MCAGVMLGIWLGPSSYDSVGPLVVTPVRPAEHPTVFLWVAIYVAQCCLSSSFTLASEEGKLRKHRVRL